MFLGEFQHSLDAKGRVILPAKFRDRLSEGAVLSKGEDACLVVYTKEDFEMEGIEKMEQSKGDPERRHAARAFFAGACEFVPDRQGRVAVPAPLRKYSHLERDVTVIGVLSRIEIWDTERWRALESKGDATLAGDDPLTAN